MRRRTFIRMYDVHSWAGVLTGLILFVVCFSGTAALFFDELAAWERPEARGAAPELTAIDVDTSVRDALAEWGGDVPSPVFVFLPTPHRANLEVARQRTTPDGKIRLERLAFDATTGERLGRIYDGAGRFLRNLHTDLHIPRPFGRYLVGVTGIIMMLMIVSGVIIHRRILRNLLTFRPERSTRVVWTDAHNVLGTWGLPFHAMIAFTGALLGLAGLFLTVIALVLFQGDRDQAEATVLGPAPQASGTPARMAELDAIIADAAARSSGEGRPVHIEIRHWGDSGARARVRMEGYPSLDWMWEHRYDLASGQFRETWSLGDHPGGRVYTAITPLHYGTYGGIALKGLYLMLGLAASVTIASGLRVWILRRRVLHHRPYETLSAVLSGLTGGMGLATAAVLAAHHLVADDADRVFNLGCVYFGTWGVALVYALWRRREARILRELLLATAATLTLAAAAELAATRASAFGMAASGHPAVLITDLLLLALAIACACAGRLVGQPDAASERDTPGGGAMHPRAEGPDV